MSKAKYIQRGDTLDYKNTTTKTIEAGTIIPLVSLIGVAGTNIAAGQIGSVHVTGAYEIEKSDTTEITLGTPVHYDGSGITATSSGTTTPAGYAASDAAAADTVIMVKLLG